MSEDVKEIQEPMSLKQMLQDMIVSDMEIIQGKVISASPLKIQVVNDEKMVISENIMCLPRHLSTYHTTVDISLGKGSISSSTGSGQGTHTHGGGDHDGHTSGDGSHTHSGDGQHVHSLVSFAIMGASMTVYNGLQVGEVVYILSFNHGKKYYILDREA